MTQQIDTPLLTGSESERLIAAVREINATIDSFADRVVQALSNQAAAPASD